MKTVHANDIFTREAKLTRDAHLTDNVNREVHCNNKCACTGSFEVIFVVICLLESTFKWEKSSCWDSISIVFMYFWNIGQ